MHKETADAKRALRRQIALSKKAYTAGQLSGWSGEIRNRLEGLPIFRAARCIALYHALPGEVQTETWLAQWLGQKEIALPRVQGDDLMLLPYAGPDSVERGAFGIWEPVVQPGSRSIENRIDLIIVPGVAFDRRLNRLGRGRGFYDRLLSALHVPRIGVCFDFQLFDEIPAEDFDRKMDAVVTEKETLTV